MTAPPLWGLLLTGGHSTRMGEDKGALRYRSESQRTVGLRLLQAHCDQSLVSCRPGQAPEIEPQLAVLPDAHADLGPLGGILTALQHRLDVAWLVLACDLPFMDAAALATLVAARRPDLPATAFLSPDDGAPERLAAIWEPAILSLVEQHVAASRLSPRRLLRDAGCHLVSPPDPAVLRNVNTPAERAQALLDLGEPST